MILETEQSKNCQKIRKEIQIIRMHKNGYHRGREDQKLKVGSKNPVFPEFGVYSRKSWSKLSKHWLPIYMTKTLLTSKHKLNTQTKVVLRKSVSIWGQSTFENWFFFLYIPKYRFLKRNLGLPFLACFHTACVKRSSGYYAWIKMNKTWVPNLVKTSNETGVETALVYTQFFVPILLLHYS